MIEDEEEEQSKERRAGSFWGAQLKISFSQTTSKREHTQIDDALLSVAVSNDGETSLSLLTYH